MLTFLDEVAWAVSEAYIADPVTPLKFLKFTPEKYPLDERSWTASPSCSARLELTALYIEDEVKFNELLSYVLMSRVSNWYALKLLTTAVVAVWKLING